MISKNQIGRAATRVMCGLMLVLLCSPIQAQTWRTHHSVFEDGDDYHFGFVSGSIGYSMMQTSIPGVVPHGNLGGAIGVGYEFRNSGLWVNVGAQLSFHRSKLVLDEYVKDFQGFDTQNDPVTLRFRVNQTDEIEWNYIDVPLLVGYYYRGFHVGGGIKVSYAINPKTYSHGSYNVSGIYDLYPTPFENMPDRGYTDYPFKNTVSNNVNVGVSLIGEIGYDLLSSLPTRSRICHVLKAAFYFEYGLNNQLRATDTPQPLIEPSSATSTTPVSQMVVHPYINTFERPAHTVPFFTGLKLTYMIGGSRTARVGFHHGCMCYN